MAAPPGDFAALGVQQAAMADALWPLLASGGKMLYATCSIFPEENQQQLDSFLNRHADAACLKQEQLLPCERHDGFYYALLENISLLLCLLAGLAMAAQAETISSRRAEAEVTADGQLSVSTRFQTRLTPSLSDALEQGVVLPFRLEFQLTAAADRLLSEFQRMVRSARPAWLRCPTSPDQSLPGHHRWTVHFYPTLREALGAVGAIQGWRVLNNGTLDPRAPGRVAGQVRLLLDIGELPKPFQLNALGSADWSLSSDWVKLDVKDGS